MTKRPITIHVEQVGEGWRGHKSFRVELRREGRKTPLWSAQYGGLDMGDGNGAADLAWFAGRQVKRQFELGLKR